ncbi:MAG: hypothetical protein ACO3NZ_12315, partial [Pirellulales bacterium]
RNRQHSREQLNDLERSLERLEQEVRERLEGQVLPSGMLTTLGTAFSVGIGLMLSGLFLPAEVTGSMAYAMAAIGLAGAGVAGASTWSIVLLQPGSRLPRISWRRPIDSGSPC